MKIIAIVLPVLILTGCIEIESKAVSFTPMECEKFDDGYKLKWTSKDSIVTATSSKITIKNENDGTIVVISDESKWKCRELGDEVKL